MPWFSFIEEFRRRLPVTFKSLKEEDAVFRIAQWAARELNLSRTDPRLRSSLRLYLFSGNLSLMGRIPVEELAILSQFIDLTIEGKEPQSTPSPGYEYSRQEILERNRETLREFKKRMQAERLWPQPPS